MSSFLLLPDDLLSIIFIFLDADSTTSFGGVCHRMRSIARNNSLQWYIKNKPNPKDNLLSRDKLPLILINQIIKQNPKMKDEISIDQYKPFIIWETNQTNHIRSLFKSMTRSSYPRLFIQSGIITLFGRDIIIRFENKKFRHNVSLVTGIMDIRGLISFSQRYNKFSISLIRNHIHLDFINNQDEYHFYYELFHTKEKMPTELVVNGLQAMMISE